MKSYEEARLYCEELLRQNPDSVQVIGILSHLNY